MKLLAAYWVFGCLTFIAIFDGDRCSSSVPMEQMTGCVNTEAISAAVTALAWPHFWYSRLAGEALS